MRVFVMGDIHGAFKAVKQCFERASFDYEHDQLIQLGDITDGADEVYECVEELLKVKNLIAIRGNHDEWLLEFIRTGIHPYHWTHGGTGTIRSYIKAAGKQDTLIPSRKGFKTSLDPADIPETHRVFFREQFLYYIDGDNNCFLHAGFERQLPFKGQRDDTYFWDRSLWMEALSYEAGKPYPEGNAAFKIVTGFREIFIGHTPTLNWNKDQPMSAANILNLDTGTRHGGRLTIMDVKTKEFWQSDPVKELYAE